MRKIALLFLLALTATTGHAECVRFAADGTSGPCELGVKLAFDAYLLATPDAMWPSANRLHYAVDYVGDMEAARLDRKVAHRAVEYIALRLQTTGMRKP